MGCVVSCLCRHCELFCTVWVVWSPVCVVIVSTVLYGLCGPVSLVVIVSCSVLYGLCGALSHIVIVSSFVLYGLCGPVSRRHCELFCTAWVLWSSVCVVIVTSVLYGFCGYVSRVVIVSCSVLLSFVVPCLKSSL